MPTLLQLEPLGDRALLVRLGCAVSDDVNAQVHALAEALRRQDWPELMEVVPAYTSLTVHLQPMAPERWAVLERALPAMAMALGLHAPPEPRTVEVPVRYGGASGPDLDELAQRVGLSPEEVVARHTAPVYRVHFLGFSPGFPYLAGLDPLLATPRRNTPRPQVPWGSVGIGGSQTGIYPQSSPGGWNLIGRTEAVLFDPEASEPTLLRPGDQVKFVALP